MMFESKFIYNNFFKDHAGFNNKRCGKCENNFYQILSSKTFGDDSKKTWMLRFHDGEKIFSALLFDSEFHAELFLKNNKE